MTTVQASYLEQISRQWCHEVIWREEQIKRDWVSGGEQDHFWQLELVFGVLCYSSSSQLGTTVPLGRHLEMAGDIFGCHNWWW